MRKQRFEGEGLANVTTAVWVWWKIAGFIVIFVMFMVQDGSVTVRHFDECDE